MISPGESNRWSLDTGDIENPVASQPLKLAAQH